MRRSILLCLGLATLSACMGTLPTVDPATLPSVAATGSISFEGEPYVKADERDLGGAQVRGYYPPLVTPDHWSRKIELGIHHAGSMGTDDFVKAMRQNVQKAEPGAPTVMLFHPDGTSELYYAIRTVDEVKAGESEYDGFKVCTDAATGDLVSFHYAEKFQGDAEGQDHDTTMKLSFLEMRIRDDFSKVPCYRD